MGFSNDDQMVSLVKEVSQLVSSLAGIYLADRQYKMVESRLKSRMIHLGIQDAQSYRQFFHDNREPETNVLVSLLTTHHSFFFREFVHFEHLRSVLPSLLESVRSRDGVLKVWSAACSRGQEVFSLAMYLQDYLNRHASDLKLQLLGSDVDGRSIKVAENGVYRKSEVSEVPLHYLTKYFSRGTGDISDFVKVNESIRKLCSFKTVNLMHLDSNAAPVYDVIFCRNVFIYFEDDLVRQCTHALLNNLHEHGLLYLGTAESLSGNKLRLKSVGTSVYSRKDSVILPKRAKTRVFCVDDSPSIVKILKNILSPEHGFEVVGSAANGVEALQLLKHIETDIITLDLHMPVMDGFEFVAKYKGGKPLIVVSSVERTDTESIGKLSRFGIRDYIEKPSLANLQKHSEEIRAKILSTLDHQKEAIDLQADLKIFGSAAEIANDGRHIHFFLSEKNMSRYAATFSRLKSLRSDLPPVFIWTDSQKTKESLLNYVNNELGIQALRYRSDASKGQIYIGEMRADFPIVELNRDTKNNHLAFVGKDPEFALVTILRKMSSLFIVLEEDTEGQVVYQQIERVAGDIMPRSSFFYFVSKWLRTHKEEKAG